jgi:hypothetical protein
VQTHTFGGRLLGYGGLKHVRSTRIACCWPGFHLFVHIFQ